MNTSNILYFGIKIPSIANQTMRCRRFNSPNSRPSFYPKNVWRCCRDAWSSVFTIQTTMRLYNTITCASLRPCV